MFELIAKEVHAEAGLVIEDTEDGWRVAGDIIGNRVMQLSMLLLLIAGKVQSFESPVPFALPPTLTKH